MRTITRRWSDTSTWMPRCCCSQSAAANPVSPRPVTSNVTWVGSSASGLGHEVQPGQFLDGGSQAVSVVDRASQQLLAVALELAAGCVDGRQQERRGAGGLLELEDQLEALGVDAVALDAEDRGLREAVERLVHAADR